MSEKQVEFLEAVRQGKNLRQALAAVGVSRHVYDGWFVGIPFRKAQREAAEQAGGRIDQSFYNG